MPYLRAAWSIPRPRHPQPGRSADRRPPNMPSCAPSTLSVPQQALLAEDLPRRLCLRARQFKDHGQGGPLDPATTQPFRRSVAAAAKSLGLEWDTTNALALAAVRDLIYNDEHYLDGVKVIGVDEHRWSHNRRKCRGGYVTVIVDMIDHHDKDGNVTRPARLLDVVPGRNADALQT